jgi:molybdenum cofactor guanylyltransferase
MTVTQNNLPCLLLAGGQSRRMGGGHKFLRAIGDKTMLDHIIEQLQPQVGDILINSNTPLENMSYPVVADCVDGFRGPLAGILTGLEYFGARQTGHTHMLCMPCDVPFVPDDLVIRLSDRLGAGPNSIVMAYSNTRIHPVISMWPFALMEDLREALLVEDLRKILVFAERYQLTSAKWENEPEDPFFNVNSPEDLIEAEKRLGLGT